MEIVLVTKGKNETVDYATVRVFDNMREALAFTDEMRTGKKEHWTDAEIIELGEEIELCQPGYELE